VQIAALVIFIAVYVGLAAGRMPGLALERTGFVVVGAAAMLVTGLLTGAEAQASIDGATLAILFGLMLLSAQYELSGLYDAITQRLAAIGNLNHLLAGLIATCAALAALLTNDVVCVAVTPVVTAAMLRRRTNPVPFLIAIAAASNIGGALTPIGNPQNILIAQACSLRFATFMAVAAVPVLGSLGLLYLMLRARVEVTPANDEPPDASTALPPAAARFGLTAEETRGERSKALILTAVAMVLFLTPVPAALSALVVGAAVMMSRRFPTSALLSRVDGPLLLLFAALFVVVRGFEAAGWVDAARSALLGAGVPLHEEPVAMVLVGLLSNLFSNVPAVMLMLSFVPRTESMGMALALGSTLAGNAILLSSIANLIVVEQARRFGVKLSFADHARVGIPLTALSVMLAIATVVGRELLLGH
jgi:Na+/H+ antiporter NhaD/arsenite permease-like protein